MKEKKHLLNRIYIGVLVFAAVVIITAIPFVRYYNCIVGVEQEENCAVMEDAWTYADGTGANLQKLDSNYLDENNTIVINTILLSSFDSKNRLCFRSKNVTFDIVLEGQTVYRFEGNQNPNIFGKSGGASFHMVNLASGKGGDTVQIILSPIYSDTVGFFDKMILGNAGVFIYHVLYKELHIFIFSIIMILVGLFQLGLSISTKKFSINKVGMISLSAIAILGGLWSATETYALQLITGYGPLWHLINYYIMMLAPVPMLVFVYTVLELKNDWKINGICIMSGLNVLISAILNMTGIKDYHELLLFTHLNLVLTGVFSFESIIGVLLSYYKREPGEKKRPKGFGFVVIGLTAFVSSAIIDIIRFRISITTDSAYSVRLGLLTLVFFFSLYVIKDLFEKVGVAQEAELIRSLAYKDALTGMYNRTAYMEDEKNLIDKKSDIPIGIIQLDINNLKIINDRQGHYAGDHCIITCANNIRESVGGAGRCYRTGGDEFLVLIESENVEQKIDKIIKSLQQKERVTPYKLAYGTSIYSSKTGRPLEDAEREADVKMYENKKLTKGLLR